MNSLLSRRYVLILLQPLAGLMVLMTSIGIAVAQDKSAFTDKPRWEFGVGGGAFSGYDYPASDDPNRRFLVLPYFIYRSESIRVGGGGVRAVAIERPRVKLDVSIGGSLNASSEGNRARAGMPDLDFLFEIGPQLEVRLFDKPQADGGRWQGRFAAELRAVIATDFKSLSGQGVVAEFGLSVARRGYFKQRLDLIASVDLTFASEELQDYFYQVDAEFVTATRPLYDARSGYLGADSFLGVGYRPGKSLRLFAGIVAGLYSGAANTQSPLFESTTSVGFAVGLAWQLAQSDERVQVVDIDAR